MELNTAGVLSSATLMAAGSSFADAVHLGFAQTTLSVGCHVVFIDGSPVLPPSEIPSLIDPYRRSAGRFRSKLGAFVGDLFRGRINAGELQAEAAAQIRRIQSSGLYVTHVDTHKHTHMFRRVLRPLLRAAKQCGVRAVRNPFEPIWSLRATAAAPPMRRLHVHALRMQRLGFARLIRELGMATTEGAIGVLATGTLDSSVLQSLLRAIPEGSWELICHPGYRDHALEQMPTRLQASREIERQALLAIVPKIFAEKSGFSLINFGELA